jgi:type IV secretory pathway VirB2 component (pilin)
VSPRALTAAAVACLVIGSGLMVGLESGLARLAAVVLLVAFIVLGALAIATPEYLGDHPGEDD